MKGRRPNPGSRGAAEKAPTMAVSAGAKEKAAKLLAQIEGELRHVDAAEDQIGEHADDAHGKLGAEIKKRRATLGPAGNDPKLEREYLYLLGQQRKARQVGGLASEARRRRGE